MSQSPISSSPIWLQNTSTHFNSCVQGTPVPRITPLQVRYIAKANVARVEAGWYRRMWRWNYYDRSGQSEKSFMWVVGTRMHTHFNDLERELRKADSDSERFSTLGEVVSYLEDMTSPAHVVPVYFGRWWRLSFNDRFNTFPVDAEAVEASMVGDCAWLDAPPVPIHKLLSESASDTLLAVQRSIDGMPASWQKFWHLAENPDEFGEYGPAGNNFGRKTEFRCGEQGCVLLDDDPRYKAFALARHRRAVAVTAAAIYLVQAARLPAADVLTAEAPVEAAPEEEVVPPGGTP
jgi:hypothetical protein